MFTGTRGKQPSKFKVQNVEVNNYMEDADDEKSSKNAANEGS